MKYKEEKTEKTDIALIMLQFSESKAEKSQPEPASKEKQLCDKH